eukprot:scaffold2912_cov67-Attheya_sp.AAC.4
MVATLLGSSSPTTTSCYEKVKLDTQCAIRQDLVIQEGPCDCRLGLAWSTPPSGNSTYGELQHMDCSLFKFK